MRVNALMAAFHGRSIEEHIGRSLEEVLPETARPQALALARRVLETGEPAGGIELRLEACDRPGGERTVQLTVDPVRGADGRVTGLVVVAQDVTALERAEQEGQLRLDELASVYAATPVGLCQLDRGLRYVRANEVLARVTGRSVGELIGRRLDEVTPDFPQDVLRDLERSMELGRGARSLEARLRPPCDPGVEHTYLLGCEPVRAPDGSVTGLVASVTDVTVLRGLEQEARQRLAELEQIYAHAPVGLCLLDRELRFVRVNERLAAMQGGPADAYPGTYGPDLAPAMARPALEAARRVIATGAPASGVEVRGELPDRPGVERTLLVDLHPLHASDGNVSGLVAVVHDVTAIKRAEQRAREAAERIGAQYDELETLYDAAPVGLCLLDRGLRYQRVNERLAQINGRPVSEHLGRSLWDVLGDFADQIAPLYRRVLETGQPLVNVQVEAEIPSDPGLPHTWLVNYYPVKDAQGQVTGLLGAVQDITLLRRQQEELEVVRNRLAEAQRVAGVGSWEWDILDDKVWWSDALYELFGKQRDRFEPGFDSFFELVHPQDRPQVRRQLDATLELDEPYWVQFRVVRDDGSTLVLRASAVLERTPAGQPARMLGTVQDVTGFEGRY